MRHRVRTRFLPMIGVAAAGLLLAGCAAPSTPETSANGSAVPSEVPAELRLGYFPNLTHAPALVGMQEGLFQDALGDETTVTGVTFNAGPAAIEALFAGSIDATFIGPNPTITGFSQSDGEALRVIAGAAANGASLVVRDGIDTVEDLAGTTLATPQLGNTQDVALRYFLQDNGFEADTEGGGDVSVQPQENATALQAFSAGQIDGAWVPEPWATRLVQEAGGHVLVDEKTLWPDEQFIVTNLIVRTEYLEQYPDAVSALLRGLLDSLAEIEADPDTAKATVNTALEELTGNTIDPAILDGAWENVVFTYDPLSETLVTGAEHAVDVGLLDEVDLDGLYEVDLLNALLEEDGLDPVTAE